LLFVFALTAKTVVSLKQLRPFLEISDPRQSYRASSVFRQAHQGRKQKHTLGCPTANQSLRKDLVSLSLNIIKKFRTGFNRPVRISADLHKSRPCIAFAPLGAGAFLKCNISGLLVKEPDGDSKALVQQISV
jgi:hypothetical protein